jgi:hypothetical protein
MTDIGADEAAQILLWLPQNQFERLSHVGGAHAGICDEQSTWARGPARVRVTRDRGQWWCDVSWEGFTTWLDVHDVAGAMQSKAYGSADRLAWVTSSLRSQTFGALAGFVRHAPD